MIKQVSVLNMISRRKFMEN